MATLVRGYPATSDRSRGWLRYLYRKATTPDNWDKEDEPHAHWDNVTGEPTTTNVARQVGSWRSTALFRRIGALSKAI
ncbi:MAG TPA: hypothetical protein VEG60_10975 [Candidatus Binatia bacterium]|nr:hypothetical protein [Candidatus Binatia bacterium]